MVAELFILKAFHGTVTWPFISRGRSQSRSWASCWFSRRLMISFLTIEEILAPKSSAISFFRIRILAGDNVTLEMSPYDLSKGRITFRHIENRQPRAAGSPAFKRKR